MNTEEEEKAISGNATSEGMQAWVFIILVIIGIAFWVLVWHIFSFAWRIIF